MRGDIRVYADPLGRVQAPTGIIGAPDGDVWFTSIGNNRIGRVRVESGAVETFADGADRVRLPANIIPAADGRLWFTCLGSGSLAAIDPGAPDVAASIERYEHPDIDGPVAIKSAVDGLLWFTLRGGSGAVGCLDPRAADPLASLHTYRSPTIAEPSALFADPGGSIWWVNAGSRTIGRLDPARAQAGHPDAITTLDLAAGLGAPRAWARDAAGHLWVTAREPAGLLRFDPLAPDPASTIITARCDALQTPDGIWLGADGALWIADTDADRIVRFDPSAAADVAWSFHGGPPQVAGPFDIKAAEGSTLLWFTNKNGNSIASIETSG